MVGQKTVILLTLFFEILAVGKISLAESGSQNRSQSRSKERCQEDLYCLSIVTENNTIEFFLTQSQSIPITHYLTAVTHNLVSDKTLPVSFTLNSPGKYSLFKFKKIQKNSHFSYQYEHFAHVGDPNAQHNNDYIYRLPFSDGQSFKVTQGYIGTRTHFGPDKYATDFSMPEGTLVIAARSGLVVHTKSDSDKGGPSEMYANDANFIQILHDDGTIGEYLHLKFEGILVHVGDKVEVGQSIGYSGNTGNTSGPHLHFEVAVATYKPTNKKLKQTIPVSFKTSRDPRAELVRPKFYTAVP
jgi:murein DD-endopeptidase MepM/ murein hydrolase activator NlpD